MTNNTTNALVIGKFLIETALFLTSIKDPNNLQLNITLLEESVSSPLFSNETMTCYGMYGCFSIESPWKDDKLRPVTVFPNHPAKIYPKFCLRTRYNRNDCQILDYTNKSSIFSSYFTPYWKTYLIIHGFLDTGEKPWILKIVETLLQNENANVIAVDWGAGSIPPYSQAVANIRLVGRMVAILIYTLSLVTGAKTENFHLIGHSLGAHLSSYTGYTLKHFFNSDLGRITGMDPAQPHFSLTHPIVRLDRSDALFIDIIHTNAKSFVEGGFGIEEPIGHLDFYPNNGNNQPGCSDGMMNFVKDTNESVYHGMRQYLACDHTRSYEYLLDSINRNRGKFISVECESWQKFLAGDCFPCKSPQVPNGRFCVSLGLPAYDDWIKGNEIYGLNKSSDAAINLYTITRRKPPFFASLYRINIKISNSTASVNHRGETGIFSIRIEGTKGRTDFIEPFGERYFAPGSSHQRVIGDEYVGEIKSTKLYWEHKTTLNFLTWRIDSTIYVESILVETFLDGQKVSLCPVGDQILGSFLTMNMIPCVH